LALKPKRGDNLEALGIDERIIFELILKTWDGSLGIGFSWSWMWTCVRSSELSD
jgi:hypothetical protein